MKRNKYFCEHCKKDLNEKVEKNISVRVDEKEI